MYTVYGVAGHPVKSATLAQQVADRLREDVLSGRLRAGERLSQDGLAERFDVSRVPVRDALRTLEAEGLVSSHPRFGAAVADLSVDDLEELYEIRIALEPPIARRATPRLSDAALAEMRRQLAGMRVAGPASPAWFEAHAAFHRALNAAAGRERTAGLADNLRGLTERYVRVYQLVAEREDELHAEHERILAAAERGDADAVAIAVREHLELVRDWLVDYLRSGRAAARAEELTSH